MLLEMMPAGGRFDPERIMFHRDNGCMSVCLALLLDVPCEAVPNFGHTANAGEQVEVVRRWLAQEHGLPLIHFLLPWSPWITIDAVLRDQNVINPGVPFIASGVCRYKDAKPSDSHAVVCCDGRIILDPFGAGILGGYPIDAGIPDLIIAYLGGPISVSAMAMSRASVRGPRN